MHAINFGEGVHNRAEAELLFAQWNSFVAQYPQWIMRIKARATLSGRAHRASWESSSGCKGASNSRLWTTSTGASGLASAFRN